MVNIAIYPNRTVYHSNSVISITNKLDLLNKLHASIQDYKSEISHTS